jgi:hypothetical protein
MAVFGEFTDNDYSIYPGKPDRLLGESIDRLLSHIAHAIPVLPSMSPHAS